MELPVDQEWDACARPDNKFATFSSAHDCCDFDLSMRGWTQIYPLQHIYNYPFVYDSPVRDMEVGGRRPREVAYVSLPDRGVEPCWVFLKDGKQPL